MATLDRYPTVTPAPSDEDSPPRSTGMTTLGPSIIAKGQVSATDHAIIEGTVEGKVVVPNHGVAVTTAARVRGDIFARTVTVLGRVDGNITAAKLIELRASCAVSGRLSSPSLVIEEGAHFCGPVEAGKADVAIALARHRAKRA